MSSETDIMSFSEKANDVSVGVSDMLSESLANSPTTRLTHINTSKEIAKTNLSMELNNERSLAILPTSVSHINTREEIAKLIYQKS